MGVAENSQRIAESAQQQVVQLKEEASRDRISIADRLNSFEEGTRSSMGARMDARIGDRMSALEDRVLRRVEDLEANVERRQRAPLKSAPEGFDNRVPSVQGLHT